MKEKLTMEQSHELIEAGIQQENASEVYVIKGFTRDGYRPCFTLADVLALLPVNIPDKHNKRSLLIKHVKEGQWRIGYGSIIMIRRNELIDAAFELVKWLHTKYHDNCKLNNSTDEKTL